MNVGIVFPHQLFEQNVLIETCKTIYLVEESLFFKQFNFHKQKIVFHRASMKFYEEYLESKNIKVVYIDSSNELSDIRKLISYLKSQDVEIVEYIDTTDNWLEERISKACQSNNVEAVKNESTLFINSAKEVSEYLRNKTKLSQTKFYKDQRLKRNILLNDKLKPIGNKWTFDSENRLKYPKDKVSPEIDFVKPNVYYSEAVKYTKKFFSNNYGKISSDFIYPTTFGESKKWLQDFLEKRLLEFGPYEDAIVGNENVLHHSVLSPLLNVGLLTSNYVLEKVLKYYKKNDIPLNSLEGFIRQILGWREFIRGVYELKGTQQRTKNFFGFTKKIPSSFWDATTGIEPIDITIKKVLETGYCHHIERLMVLGNFMLLCEFDPDEVYRWFMELFIDAYDWVMVPNVYGMSQFADGGLMATKPYISSSNYLMKMSNYRKGDWQSVWDGLFWRFMDVHRDFFSQNPRLGMLLSIFAKMDKSKRKEHLKNAEVFLDSI